MKFDYSAAEPAPRRSAHRIVLIVALCGVGIAALMSRETSANRHMPDSAMAPMLLDGDKDTITPARSATNIHRLFIDPASPLSQDSKTMLLGWMFSSPTGVDRIKAGVPVGWRVAHKTGTGGYGPTNDIGILYPPAAAPIIIAAYYHAASDAPGNEAVIAEATRLALNALGRA